MPEEYIVSGSIIYGDDLELRDGYVVVAGAKIKEMGFEKCDSDLKGLICPAFINAHTHVGRFHRQGPAVHAAGGAGRPARRPEAPDTELGLVRRRSPAACARQ